MVYAGADSYAYWGIEGTALAGDPSADQNAPFNPMLEFSPPKPIYGEVVERTFDSREPKLIYTNERSPGAGSITSFFRDPFLLLTCFTHKTMTGDWSTTDGVLTGDFTDDDDVDTLFIQYRVADQTGASHLDRLIKGVRPVRYEWSIEQGGLMKETVGLQGLKVATNTQAMTCSNDFHDQAWGSGVGGWANWSNAGCISASDIVFHWNGATVDGLKIKSMTVALDLAKPTDRTYDSLDHNVYWDGIRDFTVTLTGLLNNLGELEEFEKTYANKTKNTLIFYYDNPASYEKYLQITTGYVRVHDVVGIPVSGNAVEVSCTFAGGEGATASYSGTFDKDTHVDPSALITT